MNKPIVSFCIATYQRYEVLNELIQEILSVESDEIEVVVCDNKSEDGSIEKISKIEDGRLKVFINEINVGSSLNVHEALDKGSGEYLFYVNDRDNVDKFKIIKLIEIIKCLKKEDVAFAKCSAQIGIEPYHIYEGGKDALIMFACKVDHPTGYIFRRDKWHAIKNKRYYFENQGYGDYPFTQICAILAKTGKGAFIYGDICDVNRHRIDFSVVKSGYYNNRIDKRLWFTPEVLSRELKIGHYFLKKIGIPETIRNQILLERYKKYFKLCVAQYKTTISMPSNTAHYNFYPSQDFWHVFGTSIINGKKLWTSTSRLVKDKQIRSLINEITQKEYADYFRTICRDNFYCKVIKDQKGNRKNIEDLKQKETLKTYEKWVNILLKKKAISEYLLANNYHHVAIYGMGKIGKQLLKEFQTSKICVDYIIDQELSKEMQHYENVPCYGLGSDLPYVDIIIVTVSSEAREILKELRDKVKWLAKSINDILFVMS